jgi:hypothetical protein
MTRMFSRSPLRGAAAFGKNLSVGAYPRNVNEPVDGFTTLLLVVVDDTPMSNTRTLTCLLGGYEDADPNDRRGKEKIDPLGLRIPGGG